jgi:hypothetical protein
VQQYHVMLHGLCRRVRCFKVVSVQAVLDSDTRGTPSMQVGYTPQKHQRNALRLSQTVPVQLLAQQVRPAGRTVTNKGLCVHGVGDDRTATSGCS